MGGLCEYPEQFKCYAKSRVVNAARVNWKSNSAKPIISVGTENVYTVNVCIPHVRGKNNMASFFRAFTNPQEGIKIHGQGGAQMPGGVFGAELKKP